MKNLDSYFENNKKTNLSSKSYQQKTISDFDESYKDISLQSFNDYKKIEEPTTSKEIFTSSQFKSIDYSEFYNHVFFDSAAHKVSYAFDEIINFPYDAKESEVYEFFNKIDGYTDFVLKKVYPKNISSMKFSGNEKISIYDKKGFLLNDYLKNPNSMNEGFLSIDKKNYSFRFWLSFPALNASDNQTIFKKISVNDEGQHEGYICFLSKNELLNTWNINFSVIIHDQTFNISCSTNSLDNTHVTINLSTTKTNNITGSFFLNGNKVDLSSSSDSLVQYQSYSNDFKKKEVKFVIGNAEGFVYNGVTYSNFTGGLDELVLCNKNISSENVKLQKDDNIFPDDNVLLYLRFNEPGGSYVNSNLVIDHSGNKHHGLILDNENNVVTDTTNHKLDSLLSKELLDFSPVIIGSFLDIVEKRNELVAKARKYDASNANIIFKLLPKHYFIQSAVFENKADYFSTNLPDAGNAIATSKEDLGFEKNNSNTHIVNLCLIWARFFDQLKLHVDALSNLQKCDYDDLKAESYVNAHLETLCKMYGFEFVPIFENITKENIKNRNFTNKEELAYDFIKIQNLIWKKILINSQDIIRSKGTNHSINSLLNAVGKDLSRFVNVQEKSFDNVVDSTKNNFKKEKFSFYKLNFGNPDYLSSETIFNATSKKPENKLFVETDELDIVSNKEWSIEVFFSFNNIIRDSKDLSSITTNKKTFNSYQKKQSLFRLDLDDVCYLNVYLDFIDNDYKICNIVLDADPLTIVPDYRKNASFLLENINIFDIENYLCLRFKVDDNIDPEYNKVTFALDYNKMSLSESLDFAKSKSISFNINKSYDLTQHYSMFGKSLKLRIGEYQYDTEDLDPGRINNIYEDTTPTVFEGELISMSFWDEYISDYSIKLHSNDILNISNSTKTRKNNMFSNACVLKVLFDKSFDKNNNTYNYSHNNLISTRTSNKNISIISSKNFNEDFTKAFIIRNIKDDLSLSKNYDDAVNINSFQNEVNKNLYNNYNENFADSFYFDFNDRDIDYFSIDFSSSKLINDDINKIASNVNQFHDAFITNINRKDKDYIALEKIRRQYFYEYDDKNLFNYNEIFNIFKYFDNLLNETLTEIIPSKMSFKGFNFVYESSVLERFNFGFKNNNLYERVDENYIYTPNNKSTKSRF